MTDQSYAHVPVVVRIEPRDMGASIHFLVEPTLNEFVAITLTAAELLKASGVTSDPYKMLAQEQLRALYEGRAKGGD